MSDAALLVEVSDFTSGEGLLSPDAQVGNRSERGARRGTRRWADAQLRRGGVLGEPPPPTRIRPRLADLAKSPMTTSLRISGDSRASESSCTTVDSVDQDAAAEAAEAAALEHHDRSTLHELTAVWVETANVPHSVVAVPRDNRMPRPQKTISRTRQPRHTHETRRLG